MFKRILAGSRYLIYIPVIGSLLAAAILLIDGGLTVVSVGIEAITHAALSVAEAKHLAVEFIQVVDLFLLGTVLYIVSLGLYELFIDASLPVFSWLVITSLDDLKERLVGIIIVLLAVTFLSSVVSWDGSWTIVALGGAIGLVIFALALRFRLRESSSAMARVPDAASSGTDSQAED